jgi:hypothetical protein
MATPEAIVAALADPMGAKRRRELTDAMWAGDVERLHELAPCNCCCDEHTSESCEARSWHGCRGQTTMTSAERESWQRHYQRYHGMTADQFYG